MYRKTVLVALVLAAVMVVPAVASADPASSSRGERLRSPHHQFPKPAASVHADTAPSTAGGTGSGTNTISFGNFDSGDMCVVLGTLTGHAGVFDASYFHGYLSDKAMLSANTTPVNGVQREPLSKYRAYPDAYGLWVPSVTAARRTAARDFARAQLGEPYVINASKTNDQAWYCSKLVWAAYRRTSGVDLDADGGYFVWPVDLLNDPATYVFAAG